MKLGKVQTIEWTSTGEPDFITGTHKDNYYPYVPPLSVNENHCKIAAEFMLLDSSPRLRIPSQEEWLGVGMLERDDELKRRSKE